VRTHAGRRPAPALCTGCAGRHEAVNRGPCRAPCRTRGRSPRSGGRATSCQCRRSQSRAGRCPARRPPWWPSPGAPGRRPPRPPPRPRARRRRRPSRGPGTTHAPRAPGSACLRARRAARVAAGSRVARRGPRCAPGRAPRPSTTLSGAPAAGGLADGSDRGAGRLRLLAGRSGCGRGCTPALSRAAHRQSGDGGQAGRAAPGARTLGQPDGEERVAVVGAHAALGRPCGGRAALAAVARARLDVLMHELRRGARCASARRPGGGRGAACVCAPRGARHLQHGQRKRAGLAAAGLRGGQHVPAAQDERHGLRLDGRGQPAGAGRACSDQSREFGAAPASKRTHATRSSRRQVRDTHRQPIPSTAFMSSGSTPNSSKADMLLPGQLLLKRLQRRRTTTQHCATALKLAQNWLIDGIHLSHSAGLDARTLVEGGGWVGAGVAGSCQGTEHACHRQHACHVTEW